MPIRWIAPILVCAAILAGPIRAEAGFTPGHYFASSGPTIREFLPDGTIVRTFRIGGSATRIVNGLAIGPDGLLYAVVENGFNSNGYVVLALNNQGAIVQLHRCPDFGGGSITNGQIAFDTSGHFYVGDGAGLARFPMVGNGPGILIYASPQTGITGVTGLPNGHMLITTEYVILEVTPAGTVVRELGASGQFSQLEGIAYDPSANVIYATMDGDSLHQFLLMKIDPATGEVLSWTPFVYGANIARTADGHLLVGSRTQSPALFDANLNQVTQYTTIPPSLFVAVAPPGSPVRAYRAGARLSPGRD